MTVNRQVPQGVPSSQIFGTFRRWPLVPSAELYRLQAALTQCVELAGSEAAHELLTLVSEELRQRSAKEPPESRSTPGQDRAPRKRASEN
ncbi:hypothetical protein J2W14_003884 [Pseudarthrobacter oxydans]|uniref:hypothetical protein n=1 Tax=Pseudarthrobacter oxydans TaxID=1671 RepID=UPI0027894AE4|nr:hypothetical protein [Pseudarthrobacter oxydans]MDP9984459.1 hypothetical protein [Pseudarthrobacter oxydans]